MIDWKKVAVKKETSIKEVLAIIDKHTTQIALVVDDTNKLLGTVTDGDVRRGLLRGISLDDPVSGVFNPCPVVANSTDDLNEIKKEMERRYLRQLPILDEQGRVIRLELLRDILHISKFTNPVILMAGGLGTRLKPLTDSCPKPLLHIGGKPILENIINNFSHHGFRNFMISVNYMAEMIQDYFGDGSKFNVSIQYLHEKERLGTAGSLSLIEQKPKEPFFVMNADLITHVNFKQLLEFHNENSSSATMCVREYVMEVPFGVANVSEDRLIGLEEKPEHKFYINAGIYVLNPETLSLVPKNKKYDMPSLLNALLHKRRPVSVFPIREYWQDVGRMSDYIQANGDSCDFPVNKKEILRDK